MSLPWRFLLFIYNILLLVLGGIGMAAAIGRPEPAAYINLALSSPQNRVIVGIVALILMVLAIYFLIASLKTEPKVKSIVVDSSLAGQVSITIEAVKVIIMKAVRKVEGVKDVKPVVSNSPAGLVVYLHMMINPDYSVPEISSNIQTVVKQYLEETGGLKVSEIRVLVDDFGVNN